MANMLIPPTLESDDSSRDNAQYASDLAKNIQLTRKAVSMGVALAALDGPLPFMDIVAFTGVSIYTTLLWGEFYFDYYA